MDYCVEINESFMYGIAECMGHNALLTVIFTSCINYTGRYVDEINDQEDSQNF
jgi:hypothetical protein